MKIKFIISGVLLFLLIAVSSASAETVTLTVSNADVVGLPAGLINVQVTYDPATGQLDFVDYSPTSSSGGTPYLLNPRIDEVAYNLDPAGAVSQANWGSVDNTMMDGFGNFTHKYVENPDNVHYRTVNVHLNTPYPTAFPTTRYAVAVHLAFEGAYNAEGTQIQGAGGTNLGSTSLPGSTQSPEFPALALPVAAIIGLVFIIHRKREN